MFSLARRLCSVGGRFGPPSSVYSCSLFKRPLSSEQHQGPKKRPKKCKEGSGEQHLSADEYVKFRKDQLRKANKTLYPQKFDVRHKVKNVLKDYEHLEKGETAEAAVSVAGRIHGIRAASKKLHFIDLRSEVDAGIQIKANLKNYGGGDPDAFADDVHVLRRGDVVGIDGVPCRTEAGELSVAASKVTLLAPCLRVMPNQHVGFEIRDKRFRRRHVDFLANPERRDIFRTRAAVIRELRRFLEERDFLEVETPVLGSGYGGAAARPFRTFHNDLDIEMFLRIAPELYLKQLVVGGFDRVFEIGRQFRNEGLDATHNPEFTTCEFYEAYADYHDLMGTTEEMLRKIVGAVRDGGLQVPYLMKQRGSEEREEVLIDFEKPFERLDYLSAIESAAGRQLPSAQDVDEDGEEGRKYLKSIHPSPHLLDSNLSCGKLLDKLFSHLVEPELRQPTFVMDHPQVESPLAKGHREKPFVAERFELFVGGFELANAYTELNDPDAQRRFFLRQTEDTAASEHDEAYARALEYGLPPTAGWGMGLDRLVMLLTGQTSIREVLFFPTMRPLAKDEKAESAKDNKT